jgi:hypothetical protein
VLTRMKSVIQPHYVYVITKGVSLSHKIISDQSQPCPALCAAIAPPLPELVSVARQPTEIETARELTGPGTKVCVLLFKSRTEA